MSSRRKFICNSLLVGAAGLLTLTGCTNSINSQAARSAGRLVVGSKGFAESWIMGEMYAQALRELGYEIDLKTNVGSTTIIDAALMSGQVDIYPEYTGVILQSLAGDDSLQRTAEDTYLRAKEFENSRGVTVLNATPFENKNAVAVTQEFAEQYGLKTMEDLQKVDSFTYTTYPDNVTGQNGYEGIVEFYKLDQMKLKTLSIGLNYAALENGDVQAADVFTTDPQLLRSNFVVLEDTLNIFGFQNVVPILRNEVTERVGPEVADTLNTIHALLSTEAIQALNGAVAVNRLDPSQVARKFLIANNLIEA